MAQLNTTSTPVKGKQLPSPDDSGVSIEISEMGGRGDKESDKMLGSSGISDCTGSDKQTDEITLEMDDKYSMSIESSDSGTTSCLDSYHQQLLGLYTSHSSLIKKIVIAVAGMAYLVYFGVALVFSGTHFCESDHNVVPLVVLTCVGLFLIVTSAIWSMFGTTVQEKVFIPFHQAITRNWHVFKWVLLLAPLAGMILIVAFTVWDSPRNLASLAGLTFFVILLFLLSSAPTRVNWRPVVGGFILQFYFATLILKWDYGYKAFSFLGEEARKFLAFTDVGSRFVFGDKFTDHIFVMQVLPVVVFFSCVITMLYHLGVMQCIISKIAFVMRLTLGTTAAESLCAAGNIFVGQTEAPILIRPFLGLMTKSELHAVMVGGFATIAGGVLAAYIKFGIPPEHLLCASVMNAPCSLAVSKLLCPETEKSKISKTNAMTDCKRTYRNLLEAAAAGASQSIALVANIAANLIAFLALLSFVNATLGWFGEFVCLQGLSFEMICHYLLMPVVYLMGVRWEDAGVVAELIALKTFLNEFVAYEKLSELIKNRLTCSMEGHILSPRSEMIATYALCGFSNLSSIGIMLGGLGPMAPQRVGHMASIVISALFGGIVACLITASVAGLLVVELPTEVMTCMGNNTLVNASVTVDYLMQNVTDAASAVVSTVATAVANTTTV
ncbi:solute carrier family 28 member 3-like [Babylonia areolata]|uniref:solute carrier family 28 member 3-like n=1 Tax=Babylonia areolata TaxID=304850 RepID=UPI003FD34A0D